MPLHPIEAEWDVELRGGDPLGFPGYAQQLGALDGESVRTGATRHYAFVEGRFEVLGGSMGAVAGEKVVRAFRRATEARLPMLVVTASGGARMQEGMVSLIQMARTAAAAAAHSRAGLLSLAIYRSPTTGGVFASYGSLADLRAAEPGATIGFAGPRVVEQTLGIRLPAESHTAESAHRHGLVDALIPRAEQPAWVEAALGLRESPLDVGVVGRLIEDAEGAWGEVVRARSPHRPTGIDEAALACSSWTELRGTDPVVRAALATICDRRVVVVAMDRKAGDGRPSPAGFRLAQRAIALAGRLGLPLVTLIDTPGADPSPESEGEGVAAEIARTFAAMAELPTVSVAVCVGEGGSGGALALGAADRLLMREHAIFSVIAPEGAAAILERDATKAPEVAEGLRLTSADLLELGIVDTVVPDLDDLAPALLAALDAAVPGDRARRFDAATERWLN